MEYVAAHIYECVPESIVVHPSDVIVNNRANAYLQCSHPVADCANRLQLGEE
jgi:hypothetical protein